MKLTLKRKNILIVIAFFLFALVACQINDTCETVNIGTVVNPEYVCIQDIEE